MTLSSVICRREDLLSTEVAGELVMLDSVSGRYFKLNAMGTAVWQQLSTATTIAALCWHLGTQYEAPADVIERDVLAVLERMAGEGLVTVVPPVGATANGA